MNTATTRIRAGAPAPIQTRRVEPSMLGTPAPLGLMKYEATEFAGPEPVEAETVEPPAAASVAWVGWLLLASLFTFVCMGIVYMAGRYLS